MKHQRSLLEGPEEFESSTVDLALMTAEQADISKVRKRSVQEMLRETTRYEAATEGIAFFKSCRGGVCFSQGDLLPGETETLFAGECRTTLTVATFYIMLLDSLIEISFPVQMCYRAKGNIQVR